MNVIESCRVVMFDVDDTLVMWGKTTASDPNGMKFICPPSSFVIRHSALMKMTDDEIVECGAWIEYLIPHKKHIAQLKEHALRGHTIIVWSAGGWQWAESAVKTLGLEKYVHTVMEKPMWAYDDKKPQEYMPVSQWHEYKEGP